MIMEKIEKQSNPKVENLLWRKVNVKDFKMVKQVVIEQWWKFNPI